MIYYSKFSWAIPSAFSSCLGNCIFEQGDVLYDSPVGYNSEQNHEKSLNYRIQIISPKRKTPTSQASDNNESTNLFPANWDSAVELALWDIKNGVKSIKRTKQGNLYYLLWKGDITYLDSENSPEIPVTWERLNRLIHDHKEYIEQKYLIDDAYAGFVLPFDPTNSLLVEKHSKIERYLDEDFDHQIVTLEPDNIFDNTEFLPTLKIKCYLTESKKVEGFRDRFKEALWPVRTNKNPKIKINGIEKDKTISNFILKQNSSGGNSFTINNHGLYFTAKRENLKTIRVTSFYHSKLPYPYRLHLEKAKELKKSVYKYLHNLSVDCPNHFFNAPNVRCSKVDLNLSEEEIEITTSGPTDHELIKLAKSSRGFGNYKSAHQEIEAYLLENDPKTIATEVPIWLESAEFSNYSGMFGSTKPLTGHIDVIRLENDGKVGIWDFKPDAYHEKRAKYQLFLYGLMFANRTGIPFKTIELGYFDTSDCFRVLVNKKSQTTLATILN